MKKDFGHKKQKKNKKNKKTKEVGISLSIKSFFIKKKNYQSFFFIKYFNKLNNKNSCGIIARNGIRTYAYVFFRIKG